MKKIVSIIICLVFLSIPLLGCASAGVSFVEDADVVINPDRGFYQPFGKKFTRDDNNAISEETLEQYTENHSILHFRFGLEDFSSNMGGVSEKLSTNMLNALRFTLTNLRLVNASCILRFSYDIDGDSYSSDFDPEPELDMVLTHVKQLGNIIKEFDDVVSAIETGMFGPWGEQHSTTLSEEPDNYYHLIEAWHTNIKNRTISVRRPRYVLNWFNKKNDTSYKINEIGSVVVPDNYMIGVYNDGYLGSDTDLGTYTDKETELNWLSSITARTLFGGEVVADASEGGVIGKYNKPSALYGEASKTHTSYLNEFWNDKVIKAWKESDYQGDNKVFKGKSDYDYIAAHLGYRFVAKSASVELIDNSKIRLELELVNKGFGNLVNKKSVYLLVNTFSGMQYYKTSLDPRTWTGKVRIDEEVDVTGLESGASEVYIKIADEKDIRTNYRAIRFANKDMWLDAFGANYIGEL